MHLVSVIMPTYNCAGFLKAAIESVLCQSCGDFELIILDDGSTDNTNEIVLKYLPDPRVRYIRKEKREGLSAARNTAIDLAKGEFLAFLDADDIFLKHKVRDQVGFFKKKKFSGISYTNEIYFKEGTNSEMISARYRFSGDVFYYLKRSNFIHISTVMAPREFFKQNKFSERLKSHEDWELFLRLALRGAKFAYLNKPLSRILIRQDSMTGNKHVMDSTRREVGLIAKDYWKDFKKKMRPCSKERVKTTTRYIKMKTAAFFIGFPKRKCFNKETPQETLKGK